MSEVVRPPNNVRSAYESVLEAFRGAVEDANGNVVVPVPVNACFHSDDNSTATFQTCLYLKAWPCRRLSRTKHLDIVIKALETFTKPNWLLTKSTVYLNYFVVSDTTTQLVQSLHYDFVDGGQLNHPFFHVQLSDEVIPDPDLRSTGFDREINMPEDNHCWVTTKIPTPDMTLASVLYCLVADHLPAGIFTGFAAQMISIQERLPRPKFDRLKDSLKSTSQDFKSSHWFAHSVR